jgi:phosphomannomutase
VELCGAFSEVIRTRIGSPFVIAGMLQAKGQTVVGYEANGGFLLGSDALGENKNLSALPTRDAVLPMLALLCMAREQGVALSKLKLTLPARYTASDRLQDFAHEKSTRILSQLSQDLSLASRSLAPDAGELLDKNEVDGLRLTFKNGDIVHLRPSGNAPELRCYAESDSAERAQALCDGALKWVAGR